MRYSTARLFYRSGFFTRSGKPQIRVEKSYTSTKNFDGRRLVSKNFQIQLDVIKAIPPWGELLAQMVLSPCVGLHADVGLGAIDSGLLNDGLYKRRKHVYA
jgi:hypothetical protein